MFGAGGGDGVAEVGMEETLCFCLVVVIMIVTDRIAMMAHCLEQLLLGRFLRRDQAIPSQRSQQAATAATAGR